MAIAVSTELVRNIILMCQIQGAPVPSPTPSPDLPTPGIGCWATYFSCVERVRVATRADEPNSLAFCMKTKGNAGGAIRLDNGAVKGD